MADKTEPKIVVDVDQIQGFSNEFTKIKKKVESETSHLGNLMQKVEKAGVNKDAFRTAMKLKVLDPVRAQQFMRDLESYCRAIGIYDQADLSGQVEGFDEQEEDKAINEAAGRETKSPDESIEPEQVNEIAEAMGVDTEGIEDDEAEELGAAACRQGVKRGDNPIDDDQGETHDAWDRGWVREYQDGNFGADNESEEDESEEVAEVA